MEKLLTPRRAVYLILAIAVLWFGYQVRSVLTPFALGAGLAYLLNPMITFLEMRVKLKRGLAVGLVYIFIIISAIYLVGFIGSQVMKESNQFTLETKIIIGSVEEQISTLPDWSQQTATDLLGTAKNSLEFTPKRALPYFSGALGRTVNILVFILSSFYFLRDGKRPFEWLEGVMPKKYNDEIKELLSRINRALGNYLRGQMLLVLIMTTLTYISLSILGLPYALIISVFTGFAEIIPFVGPIIAASAAVFVAATDGSQRFGLTPFSEIIVVILLYTVLRQAEDLFIIPNIMGKLIKLHPLVVLFAVLAGGHLWGPVGLIIALPVAASVKVVLDYILEKVYNL